MTWRKGKRDGDGGSDDDRDLDGARLDGDHAADEIDDEMDDDGFEAPIVRVGDSYRLDLSGDEVDMLTRLIGELRGLLQADASARESGEVSDDEPLLHRLFPPAHSDDEEAEAEYQRLMRSELLESKLSAIDVVTTILAGDRCLDDEAMTAFMQSVNSVRLVLGSMLDVSDQPDAPEVMPGFENSREYHLYGYLSWLLEWSIRAMSAQS